MAGSSESNRPDVGDAMLSSVAQLKVGPAATTVTLHKDLLRHCSPCFVAALEGGFNEAAEQKIDLPGADIETVKWFAAWLYDGKLLEFTTNVKCLEMEVASVRLSIFADRYNIPQHRVDSLMQLHKRSWRYGGPIWQAVCELWEGLPNTSPVRDHMVDVITYPTGDCLIWSECEHVVRDGWWPEKDTEWLEKLPHELPVKVMFASHQISIQEHGEDLERGDRPWKTDGYWCKVHSRQHNCQGAKRHARSTSITRVITEAHCSAELWSSTRFSTNTNLPTKTYINSMLLMLRSLIHSSSSFQPASPLPSQRKADLTISTIESTQPLW